MDFKLPDIIFDNDSESRNSMVGGWISQFNKLMLKLIFRPLKLCRKLHWNDVDFSSTEISSNRRQFFNNQNYIEKIHRDNVESCWYLIFHVSA